MDLFATPPPTHLVYIPAAILVGLVIGFIMGRKNGIKEGKAQFLATDRDEDL
jgi:hypothetical protein